MAKQPIGEFLATLRKAHGYTQQQVADELGISNRTLSAWEQGRAYPDILTLPALAELYGVTADEIINGERAKTGDSTGVTEELSEKVQAKVYKNKITKFSSLSVTFTIIGSLGAAVFFAGTLLTALTPWLGIVFAVLATAAVVISSILSGAFYRNTLIACDMIINEVDERQLPFALTALKSKKRTFEITGWLWLACGVVILVLLITGSLMSEAAVSLVFIPFAVSLTLLIWCYIEFINATKKCRAKKEIKNEN